MAWLKEAILFKSRAEKGLLMAKPSLSSIRSGSSSLSFFRADLDKLFARSFSCEQEIVG